MTIKLCISASDTSHNSSNSYYERNKKFYSYSKRLKTSKSAVVTPSSVLMAKHQYKYSYLLPEQEGTWLLNTHVNLFNLHIVKYTVQCKELGIGHGK